jgi:putative component of membrane protein insertase Oxa1/YidC/SpoIIIJ protein YidD
MMAIFKRRFFEGHSTRFAMLFIMTVMWGSLHAEAPWGKDAELAYHHRVTATEPPAPITPFSAIAQHCIQFHQDVISPADGPRSNYLPSSSEYTRQAIVKYGFFTGYLMGCDRLMRENQDPWIYDKTSSREKGTLKWDPVP